MAPRRGSNKFESHKLHDVFTPTKPARLTFVERDSINEMLVNALQTPGKQVVVYGHSGSGKTTVLVNKLEQLYERHITTRCVRHLPIEHLILDAFDQLDAYYGDSVTTASKRTKSRSVGVEYKSLKAQVARALEEQKTVSVKRFLPPTLTPQTLARLIGAAEMCWVLEDFHKLDGAERRKLAQVMKVFMDEGDKHQYLRVIVIGAVDTARQVIEADAEMRNRVAEIHVPLMSDDEIKKIITRGEELLNFRLSAGVRAGIVNYANGLAAVCHDLCLKICQALGVVETMSEMTLAKEEHLETAVQGYLREMEDTVKSVFDRALRRRGPGKFDNTEHIIEALAMCSQDGASEQELLERIRKKVPGYRVNSLRKLLAELQSEDRGALLRHDEASGRYSFRDPVFRTVAKLKDQKPGSSSLPRTKKQFEQEFQQLVSAMLKELMVEHTKRQNNH